MLGLEGEETNMEVTQDLAPEQHTPSALLDGAIPQSSLRPGYQRHPRHCTPSAALNNFVDRIVQRGPLKDSIPTRTPIWTRKGNCHSSLQV